MLDPLRMTATIKKLVVKNNLRKYYRFRGAKWYGGIATGDVLGCNLNCVFCWSGERIRMSPKEIGDFYSPGEVIEKLHSIAEQHSYSQLRLSGAEPTIGKKHLLELLKLVDETNYSFILETNGILIDEAYARALSQFRNLHVRISFKGKDGAEFARLTRADLKYFEYQINALRELVKQGVSCHPSLMSFSDKIEEFTKWVKAISSELWIEQEQLILYPHIRKRLWKAGFEL